VEERVLAGGNVLLRAGPTNNNHLILQGGDISLNGRLFVTKDASLNGNVSLGGNLLVNGNLSVNQFQSTTKITTTNYQLVVAEDLSLNGRLNVSQDASLNGNVYVKGNVGIGTTAPAYPLHVNGALGISGSVRLNGSSIYTSIDTNHGISQGTFADGPHLFGYSGGSLGTTQAGSKCALFWNNSQYVGIGTTAPACSLDVAGRARIYATQSTTPMLTLGQVGTLNANTGLWCQGQLALAGRLYFYYNWSIYASTNLYFLYSADPENGTGGAYVTPAGVWTNSDLKFKHSINDLSIGLKEVLKLRPVTYVLNSFPEKGENIGFIAQELQEQVPLVVEFDKENKGLCVNYVQIIPVLTKAIQEQNVIVETLQSENEDLKVRLAAMEARLTAMDARLSAAGF